MASGHGLPATAQLAQLHIGDEHLAVLSGRKEKLESEQRLDLGAARIARFFFRHDLPKSLEIERAIDFVKEPSWAGPACRGRHPALERICHPAGLGRRVRPDDDERDVERWFQRLALAAHGETGAPRGIPASQEAAATLLVLREFMHHRSHPLAHVSARSPNGVL